MVVLSLGENYFRHLSQEFDREILDSVKQKGFYSYEYICDFEKPKEALPSKNELYSSLSGKEISDIRYQHVIKFWNKLELKMINDYHDSCLKCVILLLLGNALKKFRNNCLENYGLYSSYYLSAPALSWKAAFIMTKVERDLLSDVDINLRARSTLRS